MLFKMFNSVKQAPKRECLYDGCTIPICSTYFRLVERTL